MLIRRSELLFSKSHSERWLSPLQIIVKTSTQYQLQQKKNKLYVPNIKKLNINFYSDVSEKVKVRFQYNHGVILIFLMLMPKSEPTNGSMQLISICL